MVSEVREVSEVSDFYYCFPLFLEEIGTFRTDSHAQEKETTSTNFTDFTDFTDRAAAATDAGSGAVITQLMEGETMTKPKSGRDERRGRVLKGDTISPELRDGRSGYHPGLGGMPPSDAMRRWSNPAFQTRTDEISADDRAWFAAHPDRRCRIRPVRDGESPFGAPSPTSMSSCCKSSRAPAFATVWC